MQSLQSNLIYSIAPLKVKFQLLHSCCLQCVICPKKVGGQECECMHARTIRYYYSMSPSVLPVHLIWSHDASLGQRGHLSLTVAGLRAPLSRFLEGALYKYPE